MRVSISRYLICACCLKQQVSGLKPLRHPIRSIRSFVSRSMPDSRPSQEASSTDRGSNTAEIVVLIVSMSSVDQTWDQLEEFGELRTRLPKKSQSFLYVSETF